MQLTLEQRLLRFLAREEDDEQRSSRELQAQPVDLRVLDGECIQQARFLGVADGSFLFELPDNQSKFRAGDPLAVGDGLDFDEVVSLLYGSYDARLGQLRLERDPYNRDVDGFLQPGEQYVIDRRSFGLQGRLRDTVRAAFESPLLRAVLTGDHTPGVDAARRQRALERLAESGLNEPQVEAGATAIATESLALVQGPPGTGKTRLLAQVVAQLCAHSCKIGLCAFTHRAVDNALLAIRRAAPTVPLIKVGSSASDRRDELRAAGVQIIDPRRARPPDKGVVVAGTCFQLAKLHDRERFHYTVFDEAGQLPIPHALPGMLRAQRWLFFGDHAQLPPVVVADHADKAACASVFEHLHGLYGSALLDTTYRLNDGVCRVVSESFYGGRLQSAPAAASRRLPFRPGGKLDEVLDPERPVVWLRLEHRQPGQRSIEEANAVADVVEDLVRQHGLPCREIAVIAPFRAQVRLIRTTLQHKNLPHLDELVVDTVERIQGQEREAVVISLAVGDLDSVAHKGQFFFSTNRLNVAISRARAKVVLVASDRVFAAVPGDAEGLLVASRFRELKRRLPVVDLTRLYCC